MNVNDLIKNVTVTTPNDETYSKPEAAKPSNDVAENQVFRVGGPPKPRPERSKNNSYS